MNLFWRRGRRIRPWNKNLVSYFVWFSFLGIFTAVMLCFYAGKLLRTDWKHLSLSMIRGIHITPYFFVSIFVSLVVYFLIAFLYVKYRGQAMKQRIHRQKLARMILENGWYEVEVKEDSGLLKDMPKRKKEVIRWFPKIYYKMKNGELRIEVEVSMGKYQEQLQNLETKMEPGLFCELTAKELCENFLGSYLAYTMLYDMVANRITIEEVEANHGALRLMQNVWWEYDALPHMLISGGTGGGKTYFIMVLIEALLRTNAVLFILDPKNLDLADLAAVLPDVYSKKEDIIDCVKRFYENMMERSVEMKKMDGYEPGKNYAALGLPPHFLIFDEYVAFMAMLGNKENGEVINYLKKIVMLGRQTGFFLILACQRPDAKYFEDGMRDQFNFRVALGRTSELGYNMMFGETNKNFFLKQIKGRGYVDTGKSVISEFYTPLVPPGHDFLKSIDQLCHPVAEQVIEMKLESKGGNQENDPDHGV